MTKYKQHIPASFSPPLLLRGAGVRLNTFDLLLITYYLLLITHFQLQLCKNAFIIFSVLLFLPAFFDLASPQ